MRAQTNAWGESFRHHVVVLHCFWNHHVNYSSYSSSCRYYVGNRANHGASVFFSILVSPRWCFVVRENEINDRGEGRGRENSSERRWPDRYMQIKPSTRDFGTSSYACLRRFYPWQCFPVRFFFTIFPFHSSIVQAIHAFHWNFRSHFLFFVLPSLLQLYCLIFYYTPFGKPFCLMIRIEQ